MGKKGGRLRLCLDPKELSKNIKRKRLHLLASNNMCARRAGAKFLGKFVALAGLWQILLDAESQKYCLLCKLLGRHCCVRSPSGTCLGPEMVLLALLQLNYS